MPALGDRKAKLEETALSFVFNPFKAADTKPAVDVRRRSAHKARRQRIKSQQARVTQWVLVELAAHGHEAASE